MNFFVTIYVKIYIEQRKKEILNCRRMSMYSNKSFARLIFLSVLLLGITSFSHSATQRILIVGDSWAEIVWNDSIWPYVLNYYGLGEWSVQGNKVAISGAMAEHFADDWPNPRDNKL